MEISKSEIENRHEKLETFKDKDTKCPLGSEFLCLIEFLEKASSTFSGFRNDINQALIESEIFVYIFDILEYHSNSDILL